MGGVVRAHMLKCLAATLVAFAMFSLQPGPASAQAQAVEGDRVKGDIAGTVGLGLLGAEVGLLLTPAFNLQDHWWAWALFPTVGAAGGVVAGIFAFEPRSPEPAVTISILGAGLLLAVPAVVTASALSSARRANVDRAGNEGLIRISKRGARLGVPAISSAPVFTAAEQARFGLPQRSSTRLALLSGSF
jgi:hypothetical protein